MLCHHLLDGDIVDIETKIPWAGQFQTLFSSKTFDTFHTDRDQLLTHLEICVVDAAAIREEQSQQIRTTDPGRV